MSACKSSSIDRLQLFRCGQRILTAIDSGREVVARAVVQRAADAGAVAPDKLREVTPARVPGRRSTVGILCLLGSPAVDRGAGELDVVVVIARGGSNAREITATTILSTPSAQTPPGWETKVFYDEE